MKKIISAVLAVVMLLSMLPIANTAAAVEAGEELPPIHAVMQQKITQSGYAVEKYGMADMQGTVQFSVQVDSPGILEVEFPVTTGVYDWETRFNLYAFNAQTGNYEYVESSINGPAAAEYECTEAGLYHFYFDMAYPPDEMDISVTLLPPESSGEQPGDNPEEVPEKGYKIKVFSSTPSCSVPLGERLNLSFELYKDGKSIGDKHPYYTYSFADDIFERAQEGFKYSPNLGAPDAKITGMIFSFEAKRKGSTILTVTERDTQTTVQLLVTVSTDKDVMRFHEVPVLNESANGDTNFLNEGGLCVDDFTYKSSGSGYDVRFTVYNLLNMYGAVCVYDKTGKLLTAEPIERFKDNPENLYEMGEEIYNAAAFIVDFFGDQEMSGPYQYYKNSSDSKKTEISLHVPQDGYLTITTDMSSCPAAYLYNAVSFTLSTVSTIASISDMGSEITETVTKSILDDLPMAVAKKWSENYLDLMIEELSFDGIDELLRNTKSWLSDINIDLEQLIIDCAQGVGISLTEDLVTSAFLEGPAKIALSIMKLVGKGANYFEFGQTVTQRMSQKGTVIRLYTPVQSASDTLVSDDVIVNSGTSFDEDTILYTCRLAASEVDLSQAPFAPNWQDYEYMDISLYKGNLPVQPEKPVEVSIVIPDELDPSAVNVYHQNADGRWKKVDITIVGRCAVFMVDHFSTFAIGGMKSVALDSIRLNHEQLTLEKGQTETLSVLYTPEDAAVDKQAEWITSDESVAVVNNGKVTAMGEGKATITATLEGMTATCEVTVVNGSEDGPKDEPENPQPLPDEEGDDREDSNTSSTAPSTSDSTAPFSLCMLLLSSGCLSIVILTAKSKTRKKKG